MSQWRGPDGHTYEMADDSLAVASGMVPVGGAGAAQARPQTRNVLALPPESLSTPAPSVSESTNQTRLGKAPLDLGSDVAGALRYGLPIAGAIAGGEGAAGLASASRAPAILRALLVLGARSGGSGLGAGAGSAMAGNPPRQIASDAGWQAALSPLADVAGGTMGMLGHEANRAAFTPTAATVRRFRSVLDDIGKAGAGLNEGAAKAGAVKAAGKANALYDLADKSGWTIKADQIYPDPEEIVPKRASNASGTNDRATIVSDLQKVRDRFLAQNNGDLTARDIADIAQRHRELSDAIRDVRDAGGNPNEEPYLEQFHDKTYENARDALTGRRFIPGQGLGDLAPGLPGQIGDARRAVRSALGVERATSNAAVRAAQGSPAVMRLHVPVLPTAAHPSLTMSREAAATLAQIMNSRALQAIIGNSPRLLPAPAAAEATNQ